MFLVFGISIMFNTIGGQLDVRVNAFLATRPVVMYILHVVVILVANIIMMMMMTFTLTSAI